MPHQNQIIPNNDNEVVSAMDNLAKAHGQMANADMQQMAMYGELGKDALNTENTFANFIAKDRYYNSIGDAQGFLTQASQLANNHIQELNNPVAFDDKGNPVDPIHQLNKSNALYFAHNEGLINSINDSNMPNSLKVRVLREIDGYNSKVTDTFNKNTGLQIASKDLTNLKVATASIQQLHPDKFQLNDLSHSSIAILNNPYATNSQKQEAYNIHSNIALRMSHPEAQSIPLQDNEHVTESASHTLGNQATDATIKNIFLTSSDLSPSINYSADPSKNAQLFQVFDEIKNAKQMMSQSHNIPAYLDGMSQAGSPMQQKIAKVVQPLLKNNMGDYLLRGIDPQLQSLFDEYNKNPSHNTWLAYSTRLHKQAEHAGIPLSNVGDLPMDVNNTLTEVNKDYQNQNYSNELYDSLYNTKKFMRDMPIYGTSDNSNMVRLFNYGDESKSGFGDFIAGTYSNHAKEISKLYGQMHENDNDIKSYISDNERSLRTVATAVQIPESKFNDYVSTHLKSMVNNGMSLSQAKDNMNDILQGYIHTGNHDIGSNYIVSNKMFSDMEVTDNYTKYMIANNAINLSYNKQVNDVANQMYYGTPKPIIDFQKSLDTTLGKNTLFSKPSDIDTDTGNKSISLDGYKTRIRDNLGQPSDYSIITSNGQLFAKNNFTGKQIPMNDTILKTAHDHIMDNHKNYQKTKGTWWSNILDVESSKTDLTGMDNITSEDQFVKGLPI